MSPSSEPGGPEVLTTADGERWRALVPASACVTGSLEYARILEAQTGCAARLFATGGPRAGAAYPHLLRPVEALPFAARLGAGRFDTFTPEYTGPLRLGSGPPAAAGPSFVDLFAGYCRKQGIVAEFAHLHPWGPDGEGLLDPACAEVNREIVYLDLTWGAERLWSRSYSTDVRRSLRIADEVGIQVRRVESAGDLGEFHRLHALTMQRRQAGARYRYPLDAFRALFETMPDNALFLLASIGQQAVAGGLFLHDDQEVIWHLSALDKQFARSRAVTALVHHAVRWGVEAGKRRLLCGGAYDPGDGVFRFKASFSPLRAQFRIYRRIHDAGRYQALARAWSAANDRVAAENGFFPAYRTPAAEEEDGAAAS
ncbi:MAG TPA: GNAT family N-acetyltransferase [Anaeromyxobacteraceae bacterium]|jgi:hypothetical protein|nr:GNAT family N-acetyltransferase [Anaeromyxobacteraceae bacterium]